MRTPWLALCCTIRSGDVTLRCEHRNALSLRPQITRIAGPGKGESRKGAADRNSLHFMISTLMHRLGEVVSCCWSKVAVIQGLTLDGRAQVDKVRTECDGAAMQGPQPALKADYVRAFGLSSNPGSPGENGQRSSPAPLKAAYARTFGPQGNSSSTGSDARSTASAPLKEYYRLLGPRERRAEFEEDSTTVKSGNAWTCGAHLRAKREGQYISNRTKSAK